MSVVLKSNGVDVSTAAPLPVKTDPTSYTNVKYQVDAGAVTGVPYLRSPKVSHAERLQVGLDTIMFDDAFNNRAQNTNNWRFVAGTTAMAMAQANGFLSVNSGNVTTVNAGCFLQSWRTFCHTGNSTIHLEFTGNINALPVANQFFEAGFFFGSASGATPTAPTEGVFFRLNSAGLYGVMQHNGLPEVSQLLLPIGSFPVGVNGKFMIHINEEEIEFWMDENLMYEMAVPDNQGLPFQGEALPVCIQMRNTGGAATGATMIPKVAAISVKMEDPAQNRPWSHQVSGSGRHCSQVQLDNAVGTPTAIIGGSLTTPNTATTAAAALSNTAAGTAFTGLGGIFQVLPTLTAGTDGILCAYQVPTQVATFTQTPRNLVITGINISAAVNVVLAGGPLVLAYTLGYGSTAVTLATTETASFATNTTKLTRRVPIGIQACVATAAAGTQMNDIVRKFDTPITVAPSEFIHVCVRNLGVVTTTGSVAISVSFDGYWE